VLIRLPTELEVWMSGSWTSFGRLNEYCKALLPHGTTHAWSGKKSTVPKGHVGRGTFMRPTNVSIISLCSHGAWAERVCVLKLNTAIEALAIAPQPLVVFSRRYGIVSA
jgi:hypothetical protein